MKLSASRLSVLAAAAAALFAASGAHADSFSFKSTPGYFGSDVGFTGSFDVTGNLLTVSLDTTGSGGFLTAIAFNAPTGAITGLASGPAKFKSIVPLANPWGTFTSGAGLGSWHHGGTATDGVAVGGNATFVFTLSGSYSASDFWTDSCKDSYCAPLAVRFRDFNNGLGDKVAAVVPEPETYALMLAGLAAVGFMARRRREV